MLRKTSMLLGAVGFLALTFAGQAATLKATYTFNNTLASQEAGPAALTATDPLGTSGFISDSVYGNTRTVYGFNGNTLGTQQAGLSFQDGSNPISPTSYSLALVFELNAVNGYRRVLDVQNRQDDRGLYVDAGRLDLAFDATGSGNIAANQYQYVVITNDGNKIVAYLNGVQQFSVTDSQLNINNANNPSQVVNLFLDNTVGTGQSEYSSGRIALFEAFDGALSASDVSGLAANPFSNTVSNNGPTSATPEPATCSLVLGAFLCGFSRLKRRAKSN